MQANIETLAVKGAKTASQSAVEQWDEAAARLSSQLPTTPGLMRTPMARALHLAAASPSGEEEGVASAPGEAALLAWDDWWQSQRKLATGELSAVDMAGASLERLARVQERLGACVEPFTQAAMDQARESDARRRAGQSLGILDGAPLAHKDLLLRAGSDYACGMAGPLGNSQEEGDAMLLRKLDEAGALHLGRLHMTEIAFDPAGVNDMAGHCRNPWSPDHIPGGSSSGSAAVVSAGAVVGAIGSDTGGSIRIPSVLCGVTGIKPTFGLLSRAGAMSLSHTNDHLGPIARSARDCALLLEAMAAYDSEDAGSVAGPNGHHYAGEIDKPVAGLRIGVPETYFTRDIHPEVEAMLKAARMEFASMGAVLQPVPDFSYDDLNALAIMVIRAEATATFQDVARAEDSALGAFTRARLEEGVSIPASLYLRALSLRGPLLVQFVNTVMAGVDVLLAPVFAHPTPRVEEFDQINERSQFLRQELTRLTRPFNFLGLPSIALPGGFCSTGDGATRLPTGFQLIGRPYSEALLFRMGHAFQSSKAWSPEDMPMPAAMPW